MDKRRIKRLLVTSLLVMEGLSLSLTYKSFSNKPLDNGIKTNDVSHKKFAMYVENSEGKYEEYTTSDLFPTGYKLNLDKSNCIDNAGNVVENVISSADAGVTVTGNKTMFCYFYFDVNDIASDYIKDDTNDDDLWKSTLEEDGYRFVGTNPANYICFGTSDKNTCTTDTDKYMYRIIGIFKDEEGNEHLKLIKKEALNTAYAWHSSNASNVSWDTSSLYKGLNGSYFLTNTNYPYMQNETWINKISTWDYTMTDSNTYSSDMNYWTITIQNLYLHELNRDGKTSSVGTWKNLSTKISLMHASDFALSLGESVLNYTSEKNNSVLKTGWMHIVNNDTGNPGSNYEWTMTRYGTNGSGLYNAYLIYSYGAIVGNYLNDEYAVRPVFYLEHSVELDSGSGTVEDPYIIVE